MGWAQVELTDTLLGEVLDIPDIMKCPNGVLVDGTEALSVLLKRFAYPCRFAEMVDRFRRPVPQLCMTTNRIMDYLFDKYSHLLADLNQPWLSRDRLRHFAATIHDKGAPLENCWGFIDGTVGPLRKPGENQRILHNGHKRVHGIKFQSVVCNYYSFSKGYTAIDLHCRHYDTTGKEEKL